MSDDWKTVMMILIGSLISSIVLVYGAIEIRDSSYREGQINALTGKVEYHLVVKSDSTKVWEKIVNEK